MKQKKWILLLIFNVVAWISLFSAISADISPANLTTFNVIFLVATMGVLPFGFGLAALILGIWMIVKKQGGKVAAVIGMLVALPMIFLGGVYLFGFCVAFSRSGMESLKELVKSILDSMKQTIAENQGR